jgi:hypothetical protein
MSTQHSSCDKYGRSFTDVRVSVLTISYRMRPSYLEVATKYVFTLCHNCYSDIVYIYIKVVSKRNLTCLSRNRHIYVCVKYYLNRLFFTKKLFSPLYVQSGSTRRVMGNVYTKCCPASLKKETPGGTRCRWGNNVTAYLS